MPPCPVLINHWLSDIMTNYTYNDVVGARHGSAAARGASAHADDGNGAAVQGDEPGNVLYGDAEETKESSAGGRVGLHETCVSIVLGHTRRGGWPHTDSVLSQHWTSEPPRATLTGVAAARRGRARTDKAARRENILESEVCGLQNTLESSLLRVVVGSGGLYILRRAECLT